MAVLKSLLLSALLITLLYTCSATNPTPVADEAPADVVDSGEVDEAWRAQVDIHDVSSPLWSASQLLWGIMYEEIGHQGAGGLHTDLIQNGFFQSGTLSNWTVVDYDTLPNSNLLAHVSDAHVPDEHVLPHTRPLHHRQRAAAAAAARANARINRDTRVVVKDTSGCSLSIDENLPHINEIVPRAMRVDTPAGALCAVINSGYPLGIGARVGTAFNVSFWARTTRAIAAQGLVSLRAQLWSNESVLLGEWLLEEAVTEMWAPFQGKIYTNITQDVPRAKFVLVVPAGLTVWLHGIMLAPDSTWRGLPFIRPDLGDMMAALNPAFVRFPGGCFVEGDRMVDAFRWKTAIGPYIERMGTWDLWGYWSPNFLGPYELLLFSEALHATPIWVVNSGMAHQDYVGDDQIDEFVQEALDACEFAVGDKNTYWGSKRAAMGHPDPFPANNFMIAIGNEEDFDNLNKGGLKLYKKYYALFYQAIRERFPDMTIVANNATVIIGGKEATDQVAEFHDYNPAEHFVVEREMFARFRPSAYMFVSEYGAMCSRPFNKSEPFCPSPWAPAVAEAAFMVGMERYSNMVVMACSETLGMQAAFNSLQTYGAPQYYTKQIFGEQLGTQVLNTTAIAATHLDENITITAVALTRANTKTGGLELVLKMVNWGSEAVEVTVNSDGLPRGWQLSARAAVWTVLNGTHANATNTYAHPKEVYPRRMYNYPLTPVVAGTSFRVTLPYSSIHVAVIPLEKIGSKVDARAHATPAGVKHVTHRGARIH